MEPTTQTNSKPATGIKHDTGKLKVHLITPEMIEALTEVLMHGAAKYGERNFELGMDPVRLWDAAQRHMWAHMAGEILDEDSKLPHLWHAFTSLGMAITLIRRGTKY